MVPLVSVIITTKNEEKNIGHCLDSIARQTYPRESIEVIVVDNQSSDHTKEIARSYTDHVYEWGPERSAQRNHGILMKSHGEFVLYLDADMSLSAEVVRDCVDRCQTDSRLGGIYISEVVIGESYWSSVRRFERSFYDGTVIDCVRFIRRSIFERIGGFDETMTGPEDWDLDKKIRSIASVDLISTPLYHNEASFRLGEYLQKKSYYAKSFERYVSKWGRDDFDVQRQLSPYYRYIGVFTEEGKWKKLVQRPHLSVGMYLLRLLTGVQYLRAII